MKTIALVAHDSLKKSLVDFVESHSDYFKNIKIYSTGTTAKHILQRLPNLDVNALNSGPLGGDQQIGALIVEDKIDGLIFFWDPMSPHPHDVDVKALLRIAVLKNIYLASNLKSAHALVSFAQQ